MRIAQISTLSTTVRQEGSDSIEGLVWLLSRELTTLGHEVIVFAAAGSEVPGELVATLPGPCGSAGSPDDWQVCEWINLSRAVEQSGRFDVLHSHGYLWGIPLQRLSRAPMLHTLHVTPYEDEARLWSLEPGAHVSAISHYQWRDFPGLRPDGVVYHGVDPSAFSFRAAPDDYLCYLGRFIPGKGPLAAISLARGLGIRLLLAGPRNDYYGEAIERHVDGRSVEYVGYVSGVERDRLLGGARALLYPVQDPEPFGLVLVEAMMCGTPVAAVGLGAVPEIVDQGITGCHAPNLQELDRVAAEVLGLPRARVRQQAIARFSARRMASDYAELYSCLARRPRSNRASLSEPERAERLGDADTRHAEGEAWQP